MYVVWLAGTTSRVVAPGPPGWESIPRLLKRLRNTGSGFQAAQQREEETLVDVVIKGTASPRWIFYFKKYRNFFFLLMLPFWHQDIFKNLE
jgi:hypothetical protein